VPMLNFAHGLLYGKIITFGVMWDDAVCEKENDKEEVLAPF